MNRVMRGSGAIRTRQQETPAIYWTKDKEGLASETELRTNEAVSNLLFAGAVG